MTSHDEQLVALGAARTELRQELRAQGMSKRSIEAEVRAWEDRLWWLANRLPITPITTDELDDRGFRPAARDSLTTGAGRVSGATAVAVRRGKTLTRDEYLERMAG